MPQVYAPISNISRNDADFRFLAAISQVTPKMTLPGPCFVHFGAGRENISREVYPNLDDFWSDIITAYKLEFRKLFDAGCRYVQLDETSIAKLPDAKIQSYLTSRGDDWQRLRDSYVDVINACIAGAPNELRIGIHLCRGNNQGNWQAEAGYDAIAESLFRKLNIDVFFLEYDSPRAGSFEPLNRLPDPKIAVLGLLSTKTRQLEAVESVVARINEAAKHVPMDRLCVSPQCGFWGGVNLCTPSELEAKLRRVVEIASTVWA
jgi:5-methyltetrahydropteroyltriglutamate--homocysteine methyltransferase